MFKRKCLAAFILVMFSLFITGLTYAASDLYSTIEIGSSGIKGVVVKVLPKADLDNDIGMDIVKKLDTEDKNALNPNAMEETGKAVGNMFSTIQNDYSVPPDHIYIIGSSGLANVAHKDQIRDIVSKKTGKTMEFITAEKEAILIFKGIVPPNRVKQVVVIDIGSGNVKGSYLEKIKPEVKLATFEIPWGTKKVAKEVDDARKTSSFKDEADRFRDKTLVPSIRDQVQRAAGLQNLDRVYLVGGISWAMATLVKPEARKSYVRLSAKDIATFYTRATQNPAKLCEPDLSRVADKKEREKVQEDIDKIKRSVFSENQLVAGSEILKALSTELNFNRKTMFFAREALYAMTIGYLSEQLRH